MKRLFVTLMALVALMIAAPAAHATDWFPVWSNDGETIALDPDITTSDGGQNYQVWVRNSFDLPESRAYYTHYRGYSQTVAYKLTLYMFSDDWKIFNIVQVAVYGEDDKLIEQYENPDMASTASVVPEVSPDGSIPPIVAIAEDAKVIYEIRNNPE